MKQIANFINKIANAIAPGVEWTAIKPSTWVRWILAGVTTINNILIVFGITPIEVSENDLYFVVSLIFNILVLIVNTYKDNPTSKEGIFTNELMKILKSPMTDEDDLMDKIQKLINATNKEDDPESDPSSPRSPTDTTEESKEDPNNNKNKTEEGNNPDEGYKAEEIPAEDVSSTATTGEESGVDAEPEGEPVEEHSEEPKTAN